MGPINFAGQSFATPFAAFNIEHDQNPKLVLPTYNILRTIIFFFEGTKTEFSNIIYSHECSVDDLYYR